MFVACLPGLACFAWHTHIDSRSVTPSRQKVAHLQELFHVPDDEVPRSIGHMAHLFCFDIPGTLQPRLAFLQALTGVTK